EQAVDRLGTDECHTQLEKVLCRGPTRPGPKVLTGDDDVAALHFAAPTWAIAREACQVALFEGQLARRTWLDEVRIDVVAEFPDATLQCWHTYQSRSRGSVITPRTADAATVAGEPI